MTKGLAVLLLSLTFAGAQCAGAADGEQPPTSRPADGGRQGVVPPTEAIIGLQAAPEGDSASSEATADPNAPGADAGAGSARAGDSADDGSPFDYQASEEISEDLSVSFPVDI